MTLGVLLALAIVAVTWVSISGWNGGGQDGQVAASPSEAPGDLGPQERQVSKAADRDNTRSTPSADGSDAAEQTTQAPKPEASSDAPTDADPDAEVRLAVVGDIMLSRDVGERMDKEGTEAVLAGVRAELHDADLTIGNLESPLCTGGTPAAKRFLLRADPSGLEVLQDGSFDVLSLANNHILDYGPECMEKTVSLLDKAGIGHVGAGENIDAAREPLIVERNGLRMAFLSYLQMPVERDGFDSQTWTATEDSPGLPWATPEVITEDVAKVRPEVDHVIVLLHSGWEETDVLSPEQQAAGQAALDAGATAVLGAHPHRLQAHHEQGGQFVAWSMGNFAFDFPDGSTESESAVLHLTLNRDAVTDHEWTPVLIEDGFPQALDPDGAPGAAILDRLNRLSREYAASLGQ